MDGSYRPILMPHRDHPVFLDMIRYPPTVEIVENLVGGRASGIGGEFFYMRPGTPLTTYIRSGEPFRPGRTQERTEIDLSL
jgi:hypothetical protein